MKSLLYVVLFLAVGLITANGGIKVGISEKMVTKAIGAFYKYGLDYINNYAIEPQYFESIFGKKHEMKDIKLNLDIKPGDIEVKFHDGGGDIVKPMVELKIRKLKGNVDLTASILGSVSLDAEVGLSTVLIPTLIKVDQRDMISLVAKDVRVKIQLGNIKFHDHSWVDYIFQNS
jgi:hypothetical protein